MCPVPAAPRDPPASGAGGGARSETSRRGEPGQSRAAGTCPRLGSSGRLCGRPAGGHGHPAGAAGLGSEERLSGQKQTKKGGDFYCREPARCRLASVLEELALVRISSRWGEAKRLLWARPAPVLPASSTAGTRVSPHQPRAAAGLGRGGQGAPLLAGLPPGQQQPWGHRGREKQRCCHSAVRSGGSIKL